MVFFTLWPFDLDSHVLAVSEDPPPVQKKARSLPGHQNARKKT